MAKELTEYLSEALAKSRTEEGRRELLEESERLKAEARQVAQATPAPVVSRGGRPPGTSRALRWLLSPSRCMP